MTSKQPKIAIFPGAFDPIHEGHISFALEAAVKAGLEKVYLMVEPRPRHKQGVKSFEHRLAMTKLAVSNYEQLGVLVVDQSRFTVAETWRALQGRFEKAELSILLGSDAARRLAHWDHLQTITEQAHFVVAIRDGANKLELENHFRDITKTKGVHFDMRIVAVSHPKYASRTIRQQLKRGATPAGLDERVYRYIQESGLYTSLDNA